MLPQQKLQSATLQETLVCLGPEKPDWHSLMSFAGNTHATSPYR